jgi:predicted RecB family nuclease
MTITPHLFEAYLKCSTKCFLRSLGETGAGNAYAEWVCAQNTLYQPEASRRLKERVANDECAIGPLDRKELKSATWRIATECKVCAQNLDCTLHAVERVLSDTPGTPAQFIPARFICTNKLSRHDKLLLAFDAIVLSETLGREVGLGKIIHGDDFATLKVNTSALESEVLSIIARIATLISGKQPPDLILNRHCPECEFRDRCRQKATETDDLSLLAGITEDERKRHRSKGIFTVTQLSYTFLPRRTPKRAKNPARPRHPALQALAIRENIVYVHGSPRLPDSKTQYPSETE